ncbi:MAG: ATP-binding protein [Bacteroidota bacterium]|nr:ATP-binding protein [Bacteroidota bacterium]
MAFKNFRLFILVRIIFVAIAIAVGIYMLQTTENYVFIIIFGFIVVWLIYELFYYIDNTNRKLQRFFDSIRYADFATNFTSDNKRGKSFKDLNKSLTEVINAFQKIRIQGEENLLYLNTIVQHVDIGLVAYDPNGKIELVNNAAKRLLRLAHIRNISQIGKVDHSLEETLLNLNSGDNVMIRIGPQENKKQVILNATEFRQKGRNFKLVSIQDIQNELDNKELEAWQNITRVLRHEIMNSVTPIASLSSFAIDLLDSEWTDKSQLNGLTLETIEDVWESLSTIERRCQGLISFVEGYKNFSTIPTPHYSTFKVEDMLNRVVHLLQADKIKYNIDLQCKVMSDGLVLKADQDLVEMVLINLLKNAFEALREVPQAEVKIHAGYDSQNHIIVQVEDNGPGIIMEALDKIFIPFYTTKKGGSGIGLSWSRQIMLLHKGSITVQSKPNVRTVFTLRF